MAVLFVSHSSKDDALAGELETWLRANGFTDLFIDHQYIIGGAKWREELRASAGACRVVVCLVTPNWLISNECFNEYRAAWYMGKRIIPLFLLSQPSAALGEEAKQRLSEVAAEDQGVDLATCLRPDQALDLDANQSVASRLKGGLRAAGALTRVGLDPEAFAIDRNLRPTPFPGLASFGDDDADAALFYGRSREIAEVLEELRRVRADRDLRPFVILGASGAGKSSLLKAGIIPRLRREMPAWLPLRAFRPGADPLLNFAEALARTMADFGKVEAYGVIRDRLFAAWTNAEREDKELTTAGRLTLEAALEAEGRKLRYMGNRDGATILISIDQAEELARAEGYGAEALADYLQTALSSAASPWQLAFTIRTDSFPELQRHHRFQNLRARGYDLRAVPVFRFENVVEEPAKRYSVKIGEELITALINDAPEEDALPLLAFALQRLWHRYAAAGAISKDNYVSVGGLKQLVEDAAERALHSLGPEQDVPLPPGPPPPQRAELAAATFVPGLAQLNEQGAVIRRAAPWSGFTSAQQQLLVNFDHWRLVVRKVSEAEGDTVEVSHEALFREWTRLKNWLEPERARLEALRSVQLDALTWDRNRRAVTFLNHRDKRLAEATGLARIDAYRKRLGPADFDYIAACEQAVRHAQRQRRGVQAVLSVLLIGMAVGIVAWWNQDWLKDQMYALAKVTPLKTAQENALKAGDSFKECSDCPEMVVLPAGNFTMGGPSPKDFDNTRPQHAVTFSKPFAVSKYEVTFAEFDFCAVASHGNCPSNIFDEGWGRGQQPVINVGWQDAKKYVEWLSRLTNKPYRLLSEAEYEYAARAGSTTAYPWGDDIGRSNANCDNCGSRWDGKQAAPVGSFAPNNFGLYDMLGNVEEWLEDCWHENYVGAPTDGSAWVLAVRGTAGSYETYCPQSSRAARGGGFYHDAYWLRSAYRGSNWSGQRSNYLGFRVARTLSAAGAIRIAPSVR
jgi:formylglycine-generating enzyme required for sulfatase activity